MAAPLNIYVVWHPDYTNGQLYFDALYKLLNNNPDKPIARKLRIPVEQRSSKNLFDAYNQITSEMLIDGASADEHLVIALVDQTMVDDNKKNQQWEQYLNALQQQAGVTLLPVALENNNAFTIRLGNINFVRLYENADHDNGIEYTFSYLQLHVLHTIWRLLLREENPPKIKFFLSHTKYEPLKRAENIAHSIRSFLFNDTTFQSFFDKNDILPADDFWETIQSAINDDSTALVIINSDNYSASSYCVREVLLAKEKDKPITIVECVDEGNLRTLPYMGNANVVRWKGANFIDIISAALVQAIAKLYIPKLLEWKQANQPDNDTLVLWHQPEPLHFWSHNWSGNQYQRILYPDPPINEDERKMLQTFFVNAQFITQTQLP